MRRLSRLLSLAPLLAALLLLLASCSPLAVQAPEGFAELEGRGRTFRAVSPEGMLFRVRLLKNEPSQELSFWSETLGSQLAKEGYRSSGERAEFAGGAGVFYEWAAPYGNESYLYLTGLMVSRRRIALVEAAAPYPVFVQHRQALRDSLETLRLR